MIVIKNVGGNPKGTSKYELKVNHKPIATFYHNRTEDIATCLRKAAEVVELEQEKKRNKLREQKYVYIRN
jgi:hypothetical protein